MLMPGRKFDAGTGYRYGFNGKEKDKDITNGDLDFGARIYDSRLGRWLSLDPLQAKYPGLSPYNFVANSPIRFIDPDGKVIRVYYDGGKYFDYTPGIEPPKGSPEIVMKVHEACMYNMHTKEGEKVWKQLAGSKGILEIHKITVDGSSNQKDIEFKSMLGQKNEKGEEMIGTINWDFNSDFQVMEATDFGNRIKGLFSPSTVILHELGHGADADQALTDSKTDPGAIERYKATGDENLGQDNQFGTIGERKNIKRENEYVREINSWEQENGGENPSYQPIRNNHEGRARHENNLNGTKIDVNKVSNPTYKEWRKDFPTKVKADNDGIN